MKHRKLALFAAVILVASVLLISCNKNTVEVTTAPPAEVLAPSTLEPSQTTAGNALTTTEGGSHVDPLPPITAQAVQDVTAITGDYPILPAPNEFDNR